MRRRSSGFMGRVVRWLRAAFSENLGLKALSFVLALGLSAYQRGSEDEEQRTVSVDVILRLPSSDARRELMTPPPPSIHVTVRGSTRSISSPPPASPLSRSTCAAAMRTRSCSRPRCSPCLPACR
jgi:hypothetical protein